MMYVRTHSPIVSNGDTEMSYFWFQVNFCDEHPKTQTSSTGNSIKVRARAIENTCQDYDFCSLHLLKPSKTIFCSQLPGLSEPELLGEIYSITDHNSSIFGAEMKMLEEDPAGPAEVGLWCEVLNNQNDWAKSWTGHILRVLVKHC